MNFLFSTRRVLLWDKEQQRLSWMKRHVSLSLYFRVWIPRERGEGNAITKVIDSESWGEGLENPKRLSSLWWWRKGSFRGVNHPPQRRSNLKQIKWSRNEKMSLLTRLAFFVDQLFFNHSTETTTSLVSRYPEHQVTTRSGHPSQGTWDNKTSGDVFTLSFLEIQLLLTWRRTV